MSQVFISYRQTDDAQKQRVREFAERLREKGIDVILDQFFLDDNPAGPNEGWPQWSSARASKTDYVLIIGNQAWFQCFDGTQASGTGLGAAREARDIFQRIYDASGVIDDIRVVLFDDADAVHIPIQLKGYHRFHAEDDFRNIVRWLRPVTTDDTPRISIPHNLPSLQPFFGREEELERIADALDPESRTWGALIDGPGGMGKTSLAVRSAYDAADTFDKIVFVSLKSRELDDDGVRDLSGFLISGLAELLNELARELGHADISKATEDQRPRMLRNALSGKRILLVLDNLESLLKPERDVVFTFVKRLPPGCKAILTSRGRIGSGAEELILGKFSESAALATLAELAETNPALAKANEQNYLDLYRETGGNPLLLRWTAGQIGRGSCITLTDAIAYLRSCPEGNDPLEFIFGDLVENFSETETSVLCALTYFTLPARVQHITELAERSEGDTDRALRSLINRSLVSPSEELKTFILVPLVADFLRKKKPDVVAERGDRLEKCAYALAVENGYRKYQLFPVLDAAWPTVSAALPRFLSGDNVRLQTLCSALYRFLDFTGRWDEWLALCRDAESLALSAKDFYNAGWRAYQAAWIHFRRGQGEEVLACADRAEAHWRKGEISDRERTTVLHLRGIGYSLTNDLKQALASYREAVELRRTLDPESEELAAILNDLAHVESQAGDLDSAERNYREALRIVRLLNRREGIATCTINLAKLALVREDWLNAEALAHEGLLLCQEIGRLELTASASEDLASALIRQGKKNEALQHSRRAVEIYTRLGSYRVKAAQDTLFQALAEE